MVGEMLKLGTRIFQSSTCLTDSSLISSLADTPELITIKLRT
jgi:hypothetical protein